MSLTRAKLIAIAVVVIAGAVVFALVFVGPSDEFPEEGAVLEELGEGVQSVVLTFADPGGSRAVEETRDIVVPEDKANRGQRILQELAAGPIEGDAVGTIPPGTEVRSVFFDDTGGVYVDLNSEFIDNHPCGSTGELFTIRSIVRTLAMNFADVRRVSILVEGEEIETVAGHIDASVPFLVEQYR